MKNVLFAGEINVDLILGGLESFPVEDREVLCSSLELTIGSSTAICACNYASLGGRASFVGLAGRDEYGEFMVRGMEAFGIDTRGIRRTGELKTGLTVNLIFGSSRTQVTYPGTIAAFGKEHLDFSILEKCSHLHIGGPYLQTSFLDAIADLLRSASERGATTSMDPQWDPTQKWRHLDEWLPLLDFFFPNRDEALSMTGRKDLVGACEALAGRTRMPVVKIGAEGALVPAEGSVRSIPAFDVEIVDTTGAGDAFDAGFLFATLEKGADPLSAARFANGVAARSCRFVGGVSARSSYQQIIDFMKGTAP